MKKLLTATSIATILTLTGLSGETKLFASEQNYDSTPANRNIGNPGITHLDLGWNNIGAAGALSLASRLPMSITHLNPNNNEMLRATAEALAETRAIAEAHGIETAQAEIGSVSKG